MEIHFKIQEDKEIKLIRNKALTFSSPSQSSLTLSFFLWKYPIALQINNIFRQI